MSDDLTRLETLKSIFKQSKVIVEYYQDNCSEIHTYTRTESYIPVFVCVMSDHDLSPGDERDFQLIKDFSLEAIEAGVREWAVRILDMTVKDVVVFYAMGSTKY